MKKVKLTMGVLALSLLTLTACNDSKNENREKDHSEKDHDHSDGHHHEHGEKMSMNMEGNGNADAIVSDYLNLKNALVKDDNSTAKEIGEKLFKSLSNLDASKYSEAQKAELKDIIVDASEHAEHISENPLKHQREHFDILSKDVIDMIAITGTDKKLYQDFCPMYNDYKGAQWLSASEEIKNPYYGSKMAKCGKIQKEIN